MTADLSGIRSLLAGIEGAGEFLPPVWTSNEVYRARLIQAIEAVAPHIMADAWELGMVTMYATTGGEWPLIPEQDPYRPTS